MEANKKFKKPRLQNSPLRKSIVDPWTKSDLEKAELFAEYLVEVFQPANDLSDKDFENELNKSLKILKPISPIKTFFLK